MQFAVTADEKTRIKRFARDGNFKTTSEFIRRVIFDYIRRQEHPELSALGGCDGMSSLLVERLNNNVREVLRNQEIILQREDKLDEMGSLIENLHRMAETSTLSKEREAVISALEKHSSLSLRTIQEETRLPEDVVFKIISDTSLFKLTPTGRFALR